MLLMASLMGRLFFCHNRQANTSPLSTMPIAFHITLDHDSHTYSGADGTEYTSVSRLIAKYKEPFDADAVSQNVAKKEGRTPDEVRAEWASAAPYGTAVHKQMEDFFTWQDSDTDLIDPYRKQLARWRDQDVTFHPEAILYLPGVNIAGTADLLVERPDGQWSILDWKTNKAIRTTGYKGKKMRHPFEHLDDCNHVHYSLQLSLYALMLGRPIKHLNLVHIPRGQKTLKVIPCLDLRQEAGEIVADHVNEVSGVPF